ncbi:MAG: hypothetical protein NVSMB51_11770 [Solirubrobacteraceae bacterium]
MATWPRITESWLLQRLAMSDEEFDALLAAWAAQIPRRTYETAMLARAFAYPWSRPQGSFVLTGAGTQMMDELTATSREAVVDRFRSGTGRDERWPLLAFGANAAPDELAQRLARIPDEDHREVLVLSGYLHDFDVGAAPQPTLIYGAMPGTLFPSPGTAVRAAVLWVTAAQFTHLASGEISYHVGRLQTRFAADETALSLNGVLAFVSRFGAFCVDGQPVAMSAIPARGRVADALSQEQLLDAAAKLSLGAEASAQMLVRAIFEDLAEIGPKILATVRPASQAFRSDRWTPFPHTPPA